MKRTITFGGIVAATGLLAAGLATPAQAADEVAKDVLANTNYAAQQVAKFWYGENKANLINATPYNVETTLPAKHVSGGGPAADTKPGVVPAIGDEKKAASKSKNVNLPKTSGKVFFIGADKKPHWCSATSVQSQYRNLVATAGHCVYDTESNKATLDKWVFVPGYYQGKTPWGIYVGKTAYTHYDFDVYEDGDRDYAFVTVYNGVLPTGAAVSKDPVAFETKALAEKAKADIEANKENGASRLWIERVVDTKKIGPDPVGSEVQKTDVTRAAFKAVGNNASKGYPATYAPHTGVNRQEFTGNNAKQAWETAKAAAKAGNDGVSADGKAYFHTSGGKYYKHTYWIEYDVDYVLHGRVLWVGLKDVGRLGDNVGGQGLAYNQKVGVNVFVFGYPSGSHPDGNHAYNGKTLKWSYGKTFAAQVPAIKGEELVGVKSSFTGEGSLGSSWLLQYKSAKRIGYLNGVTIAVADRDGNKRIDTSVSPYFDGETYGVYKAAASLWSGKIV